MGERMQYLRSFDLASERDELKFALSPVYDMECYSSLGAYPFDIFPKKKLHRLEFAPITILYGGNGSGKSTILNVIAEKLDIKRTAPFNKTPTMQNYLEFCEYESYNGSPSMPRDSEIITSDGVFDFLLDMRAINEGVDRDRNRLFDEYHETVRDCRDNGWQIKSLDEYDELKRRNDARKMTSSKYTARRMQGRDIAGKSNGESAYLYFTERIKSDALYLLDEPENSLSAKLQCELARFLEDSARFYGCQLIISTHSPFLLSIKGAKIYDLDSYPVAVRDWTELENVRAYYDLFLKHRNEF